MTTLGTKQDDFYCVAYPQVFELSEEALHSDSMKINHTLTLWIQLSKPEAGDVIYIMFPWGEKSTDFTGREWGQAITGKTCPSWNINEAEEPELGRHWVLKPVKEEGRVEAVFENINFLTEGISCVMIRYRKETKQGEKRDFCYRIPILKKSQKLRILQFEAKKRTVMPGEGIKLTWKAKGADSLVLNPGNIPLPLAGTRTVYTNRSMVYSLCAKKQERAVTKELEIYVGGDAAD
ncbi:MAG: hypothetical protein NC412_04250 [Roseburia sp.]|nr:hypothetical protein [Roseburia sp.]MCM1278115.1 hypothetical protein [Robinsoniella sp.]